ncbi:MAG: energy-coupled thiamine transporter ThiT [Clostridia bacterium]|nr:energy-coupled thiamine transporter ThiT [Clostridia bacterium]
MSTETRKSAVSLHVLTECALMIALATVLSLVKIYEAPFGGSVTLLSMAPIIVLSMRHGVGV